MKKTKSEKSALSHIGIRCRNFRKSNNIKVEDVASLTRYTTWSVYAFEQGRLNSLTMLMAYVALGFKDFDDTDIFGDDNDVIKVIRCRNCANYFPRGEFDGVEYGECYYDNIVHPDDYCSMAELRGDSDD